MRGQPQSKRKSYVPKIKFDSELFDLKFRLLPDGNADLNAIPIFPGGLLRAAFSFRTSLRDNDGLFSRPDFAAAWEVKSTKSKDRFFGGDSSGCTPCTIMPHVTISLFDSATGEGRGELHLPMLVGWKNSPPLFEGANDVTVWVGLRTSMLREPLDAPSNFLHRFAPIRLGGQRPAAALCLHAFQLRLGDATKATLLLAEPAKATIDLEIKVVPLKSTDNPRGLRVPNSMRLKKGESLVSFPVAYERDREGNSEANVRLLVHGFGIEAFSAPLGLTAMEEAPPGFSRSGPMRSDVEWFDKCTRNAAPFNLPPGAVWVRVGPCLPGGPAPPPPVQGGPVLLYFPHACTFNLFNMCTVLPIILNGTVYNKLTVFVACVTLLPVPGPGGRPVLAPAAGLQEITIYTAIGPGRAVVDDCS